LQGPESGLAQPEKGEASPPGTKGKRKYREGVSRLTRLGKDRRTVKLSKLLVGQWGEGTGFPLYLALQQTGHARPARRRGPNGAEFGYWLIVPAHDDHFTLCDPINVAREVGLGLLNVDLGHTLILIIAQI
jgi:hypothetical protein